MKVKSKSECGRLGGLATLARHGANWFQEIGRKGGRAFVARYLRRGYGGMYTAGRVDWSGHIPDSVYDSLRDNEVSQAHRADVKHEYRRSRRKETKQ